MGTYISLSDREAFGDLDRCLFLLPTETQEKRHEEELSRGDIRGLVNDPDVDRIELSLEFIGRLLRSSPPEPGP